MTTTETADRKIFEAHSALEDLVREHEKEKGEKQAAMKRFNAILEDIQERMEGQLRVLDALRDKRDGVEKQPELPFAPAADGAPKADAGEPVVVPVVEQELDGEEGFGRKPLALVEHIEDGEIVVEEVVADDGTLPFDEAELAELADGADHNAAERYSVRTGCRIETADAEVKAWRAAQDVPAEFVAPPMPEAPKRGCGRPRKVAP